MITSFKQFESIFNIKTDKDINVGDHNNMWFGEGPTSSGIKEEPIKKHDDYKEPKYNGPLSKKLKNIDKKNKNNKKEFLKNLLSPNLTHAIDNEIIREPQGSHDNIQQGVTNNRDLSNDIFAPR